MERKTSFGLYEILSEKPLIERMTFNRDGNSHTHDEVEYCYVLSGSGKVVGSNVENVQEGDLCHIPAGIEHWMIPHNTPFKLLIFYG